MITDFKQIKNDVLLQYNAFLEFLNKVKENDGSLNENSIVALENQAKNIREDKFHLMVVGEAKSGKSTFINAYLGKEILPMDVKQCTSAIVEIRYGEEYRLIATYADGRKETLEDESAIRQFLLDNAAIDDEYRDIPVPTINNEILVKKQGKEPFSYELKDLMAGIKAENIHHLPEDEYERKVRNYIMARTPVWRDIVTNIEIRYPFEDEDMKGIEIVDTPGVNADGRVGETTHEYIKKADAVMFLKPISGAALEATSFKRFLEGKSADRHRETMFLILTRSASETAENNNRIREEALKQFPGISSHQIIYLDSKVQLFYSQIKDMTNEELISFMEPLVDEEKIEPCLEAPWWKAKCKRERYLQLLKGLSNFDMVEEALNRFARKAHYIALSEFLGRMLSVLDSVQGQFDERVSNFKKKAKDPIKLEAELADKKSEIENLKLKINTTTANIGDEYTLPGGKITTTAEKVAKEYKDRIDALDPNSPTSMEELDKITFQTIDKYVEYQNELQREIVEKCDKQLVEMADKSSIPFSTLKPDLTPEIMNQIKEEQKATSNETQTDPGGCFRKARSYSIFSQSKFFNNVNNTINIQIEGEKTKYITKLGDFVSKTLSQYRSQLVNNAEQVKREYDKVLNDKAEAEELQEKIKGLEGLLKGIAPLKNEIDSVKERVDCYV